MKTFAAGNERNCYLLIFTHILVNFMLTSYKPAYKCCRQSSTETQFLGKVSPRLGKFQETDHQPISYLVFILLQL